MEGDLGEGWVAALDQFKQQLAAGQPKEATRVSSQNTLEMLVPQLPALFGGSADLTGSNNTKTKAMQPFTPLPTPYYPIPNPHSLLSNPQSPAPSTQHPTPYSGRYIYYGVREHGMAAAMNGLALHGGFIPYGGTFLVFTDYCRPSIRLSALMQQRVIYVMTHDSIGLGEDGPTHQPVEHLASLRAIPNLHVFRPADATETAECWQLAIAARETPSILALTRQALPHLRAHYTAENLCARGAYVLREAKGGKPVVVLMATGSEVMLAVEAQEKLEANSIATRVVSVPCMELFMQQPKDYRDAVLGKGTKRIAIEAGIEQGWEKLLGEDGVFIGMKHFGASAPAEILYQKFGITVEAILAAAA
jgi:transketolase